MAGGHPWQSCPLREAEQRGQVGHQGREESRLSLKTLQPRPQGWITSQWPVGTFPSNQMSPTDTMMTPSSLEGQGAQLVPDGTWPAACHLWACAPLEKTFLVIPRPGMVSSFLLSILLCVQAALKKIVRANITVLNIPCDSTPHRTQRPRPLAPSTYKNRPPHLLVWLPHFQSYFLESGFSH